MEKPNDPEIEEELNRARDTQDETRWPAATFEQGVVAALEWVQGQGAAPMEGA